MWHFSCSSADDQHYSCPIQTSLGCIQCQSLNLSTSSPGTGTAGCFCWRVSQWVMWPEGFEVFKKQQGHLPHLLWASFDEHILCWSILVWFYPHENIDICQMGGKNIVFSCFSLLTLHDVILLKDLPEVCRTHRIITVAMRWPWWSVTLHPSSLPEHTSRESFIQIGEPSVKAAIDRHVRRFDFLV